ncbi:MAG: RidA family protein [Thermogutta sp.]
MEQKRLRRVCCFLAWFLIVPLGCQKPTSPSLEKPASDKEQGQTTVTAPPLQVSPPKIKRVKLGDDPAGWSAVCIQGYPLIFTGQVFAENGSGDGKASELTSELTSAWGRLEAILEKAGSQKDMIVRLNLSVSKEDDVPQVIAFVRQQLTSDSFPALTLVVTPLPREKARVAFDAIAYLDGQSTDVKAIRLSDGSNGPRDAVVCPPGGLIFFSGQPDKNPLPTAAENAITALLAAAKDLHVEKADIMQIRVFIQPISESPTVLEVLQQVFAEGPLPPVVFTEWIASAPVEIEMIARLSAQAVVGNDRVRFYNPPGVKPSPTFSRVAIIQTDRLIFLPGMLSRKEGSGQEQVNDIFAQMTEGLTLTGSDLQHMAKATYYVVDKEASDAMDAVRKKLYNPDRPPAASKVTVHGVGLAGRTASLDVIAVPAAGPQ